jgi:hypothetical protein
VLLRVLREIFGRKPAADLPRDEAGFDRLIQQLVEQERDAQALAAYDAAIAAGVQPCDAQFDRDYRQGLAATGTPPSPLRRRARFHALCGLLDEALALEGDIVECGCFRGLSSFLLLTRLKRAAPAFDGHGYHIFDSFEGLSEPSAEDRASADPATAKRVGRMLRQGWFATPLAAVRKALADFPGVAWHPGWIPQSFAGLPELRYRFVHLDLDLHDPTLGGLEYFYPRLVPGAIIVCDDYDWPGERRAVEDFCARQGIRFQTTPYGQAVIRR